MHFEQAMQARSLTKATCGLVSMVSRAKRACTLEAAALPWATEEGISLGPWHAPAR